MPFDMKEGKQEVEDEVKVEEEDDDGPPPGFQSIIRPPPTQPEKPEAPVDDDDDDDGPPPGFDFISPKPAPPVPSSDMERGGEQQDTEDDDGPPPGWEFSALARALPNPSSDATDENRVKNEEINEGEEEDDGPPPGWETVIPHQIPPPSTQPLELPSAVASEMETGSKSGITRNDDEASLSMSPPKPVAQRSSPPTLPLPQVPKVLSKEGDGKKGDKIPTSGKQSASPEKPLPSATNPSAASSSSRKAQLVCGTCRKLLLYPRGAKWVKCPGCQELNFVLEAHEVGQVTCGGCATLLMYPHGAPAVQCSSCHAVTEVGAHNRRPPLSVQQAQAQAQAERRRRHPRVR